MIGLVINSKLKAIHSEIEKELKKPVESFSFMVGVENSIVNIKVKPVEGDEIKTTHESGLITQGIKSIAKLQLTDGDVLNYVVIQYNRDSPENNHANIYYTNRQGEKEQTKYTF